MLKFCLSLGLGAVSALAMQPYEIWGLALFGLAGFWIILSDITKKSHGYAHGFLFGLGYFLAGTYWISNALMVGGNPYEWAVPLAMLGLPTLLALFPMIASGLFVTFTCGKTISSFLSFVLIMSACEWIRGHAFTGFPWNLFGMTWLGVPEIVQIANIIGVYGLSLLTIFIGAWCGFLVRGDMKRDRKIQISAIIISCISIIFFYGSARLDNNPTQFYDDVIVRVISPNIPQDEKWNPILFSQNFAKTIDAMGKHFGSLKTDSKNVTRILVLPETSLDDGVFYDEYGANSLRHALTSYTSETIAMIGFLRRGYDETSAKPKYYNSITAIDSNLNILANYDKTHLVPFGEYMPLQTYIPLAPITNFEGLEKGDGLTTWSINNIPSVSPLVCYEIIFPSSVIQKHSTRAEWIVNATNDAWYDISPGPYQHLAAAQMRAIEEGVPVIRSANTGISAIIDSYGRILTQSELFKTDAREEFLPKATIQRTLYSVYNDMLFYVLLLCLSITNVIIRRNIHRK